MGMFDEIVVEYPLPDGWRPGPEHRLQTKDFECALTVYELRADGTMWERRFELVEREDVPEDANPWERFRHSPLPPVPFPYHGRFRMYSYEDGFNGPWHEYAVKFTDGRLAEIVKVEEA